MRVLDNLEPKKVFSYFEDICSIPHGSTNLDAISAFLEKFALDRNLFCIRDKANNVIIIKEASEGYENVEPIILQGHMDMVAVKKADCDIDLMKDPLRVKVDGDFIYAEGTSLGGDDGIAVAYILAILDDDSIRHPRIEAVITTDEEIGMEGATAIDLSMLKARRMMNIDSEEEGILLTSCAGGARVDCNIPVERIEKEGKLYEVEISGLLGGHSGTEINKNRQNAIKLIGRIIYNVLKDVPVQICELSGGEKDNAIPRQAKTALMVPNGLEMKFEEKIKEIEAVLKKENQTKEKNLCVSCKAIGDKKALVLDEHSTVAAADFLMLVPNGVMAMSADIEGLVETSLNFGILNLEKKELKVSSAVRSSIETAKRNLMDQLEIITKRFGGYTGVYGEYPGWQFDPDSKLRALMVDIYREMFGKDVKVEALHAGLECGIMISKIAGLDCASFGPNIYDIHTTEEKLSISSTQRMWDYILKILATK